MCEGYVFQAAQPTEDKEEIPLTPKSETFFSFYYDCESKILILTSVCICVCVCLCVFVRQFPNGRAQLDHVRGGALSWLRRSLLGAGVIICVRRTIAAAPTLINTASKQVRTKSIFFLRI